MKNREIKKLLTSVLLLCIVCLLGGCKSKEDVTSDYVRKIEPEARPYFEELVQEAAGTVPGTLTIEFRYPTKDFAKKEILPVEEILSGYPVLLIGVSEVREEEIRDILKEASDREIVVHFFFNGDRSCIYKAENGRVTVDREQGADGGAMRIETEYPLE